MPENKSTTAARRAPRNTAEDPIGNLVDGLVFGDSAIPRQEAEGQRSFVNSDTLPTDMGEKDRLILEAAGVKFLGPVEGDPLFQYVELPAGWAKKPTTHSMWSELEDERGRKRAAIFYKAAFYDRAAHLNTRPRYSRRIDYDRADAAREAVGLVLDCEETIHETAPRKLEGEGRGAAYYDTLQAAEAEADAWLDERFPDWRNAGAYWSES